MKVFSSLLGAIGLTIFICTCSNVNNGDNAMDLQDSEIYRSRRVNMVETQIKSRGIKDSTVLAAMRNVKRHHFVPDNLIDKAYADRPLPIGHSQTISQPYIVAYMTEALDLEADDNVLEIGTGSGYQSAVLAEIVKKVYTIEIVESLAEEAEQRLNRLGYNNIQVKCGDGYEGWQRYAPYDAIIITAAPPRVPTPLKEQLAEGGRMIIPIGAGQWNQELLLLEKKEGQILRRQLLPVRFVPMTGKAQQKEKQ